MAMNGSIRCVRCNSGIDEEGDGICPQCKKAKSYYINIYWQGKHHPIRLRLDWEGTRKKLRKIRADIDEETFDLGEYLPLTQNPYSLGMKVEEWLTDILKSCNNGSISEGTARSYHLTAKKHFLLSGLSSMDVRKIDGDVIKTFLEGLSLLGTSKRTVRGILKVFFTWLRWKNCIASMPPFPRIKGTGAKPKYVLTPEQQEQAFLRIPEHMRDIFRLMAVVGARVSEILTLRIKDINLDRRTVMIQRTWSGRKIKEAPKTNKARVFPLSDTALEVILRNVQGRIGNSYLFCKPNGEPYSTIYIDRLWRDHSGFDIPLKDGTRRSWATNMRNAGVPIEAIQKGLGHSSVVTTELYLDGDVDWAREIFNKAEKKFQVIALNER
jgi:integrase